MVNSDEHGLEMAALRRRLSRLSEASLRISESLDLDTVLREVVDSARALTGSRYGVITTLDDSGLPKDFVTSGMTPEDHRAFENYLPDGLLVYRYLSGLTEPLRGGNYREYIGSLGLSDLLPFAVNSFLVAPIRHAGKAEGNIYLAKQEPGDEFTQEDEETLVMFASQAALVIANASQHRSEQQARANLETLIETSPVGVAVFDARTGAAVSFNREVARIMGALQTPGLPLEQLLEVMTIRRSDGREISLEEFPLAQALTGETVRAEEIIMQAPDGRSVTTLVNASPIYSPDGSELESMVVTLQDMTPLEEMERLRAELLGVVSHELRTPLAAIRGSATTMLDDGSGVGPRRDAAVPPDHRGAGGSDAGVDQRPAGRGSYRDGHAVGLAGKYAGCGAGRRCEEHVPERRRPEQRAHRALAGPAACDGRQPAYRAGAEQPADQRGAALARVVRHTGVRRTAGRLRCGVGVRRRPGDSRRPHGAPVPEVLPARRRG